MSTDFILQIFRDFQNIKNLILSKEKLIKLNEMKNPTIPEYLDFLRRKDCTQMFLHMEQITNTKKVKQNRGSFLNKILDNV